MYDDVADERRTAGRFDRVPPDRDHPTGLVHHLRRRDGPVLRPVGEARAEPELGIVLHRALTAVFFAAAGFGSSTGSRDSRCRSRAAETRPENSGCGLVGRDRSSGCAWVATKYGCTDRSSSMNSTSSWSGERPLNTRPAVSSLFWYALFTS